tara:strand:+ start:671 stop:1915 length:1245 start_codon:yes stop_codon:yes gene_type:complete
MSTEIKSTKYSNSPFAQAWVRLKRNFIAMLGLYFMLFLVFLAIGGYLIIPDSTPNADNQILELQGKNIGFNCDVLKVRHNSQYKEGEFLGMAWLSKMFFGENEPYTFRPILGHRFEGRFILIKPYNDFGDSYELKLDLTDVVFAKSIHQPAVVQEGDSVSFHALNGDIMTVKIDDLIKKVKEENLTRHYYVLGSDTLGRDIYSRLILGVRVSLAIGFITVIISLFVGVVIGALAGYFGGWVDDVIMWLINVVWSIPTLLLVFALILALDRGFWQIFIAVGITMWVEVARIIRGQVISVKEQEFIEASRALGFRHVRIIFRHILPNIIGPIIVIAAANFAAAILIEAGLSYLGIGVQPPAPTWGGMIRDHYGFLITEKPFLALIPGLAIVLTVYSINLFGNGLRDAFDVKSKKAV